MRVSPSRSLFLLLRSATGLALVVGLSGCAVGRDELTGDVVLGFKAGRLVETANQAAVTGLETLGTSIGIPGIGGLALVAAKLWKDASTAKASHESENRGYDMAVKDLRSSSSPPSGVSA